MSSETGGNGGVLRELLASFGFAVDTKELEKGETRLSKFGDKVKKYAEGIAAAFAVDQIYEFAEGQAVAMNAIERTGAQLGITTDRVQEFQFAAQSLGLDADALTDSMSRMQVAQQMAADGSKEQVEAFQMLGLSISQIKGKNADELFLDVADGISKLTDPSKQAAAAQYILGRSGRQLLPFLKEGRAGAEEYFKTFRELGGGYTEEALKAGRDFDKQQAKTSLALTAVKNTIAKTLLPIITSLSHGLQIAVTWFTKLAKDSHIVEAALISLGAVATGFALSMTAAFAPVLLAAAAIAVLVLAIDDLYTFLSGGQSEIGELIDKIFGKGAQTEALEKIRSGWASIRDTFSDLAGYVGKVVDGFKWLTDHAPVAISRGRSFGPQTAGDAAHDAAMLAEEKARARDKGLRDVFGNTLVDAFSWNPGGAADKHVWDSVFAPPNLFGGGASNNTSNVNVNVNVPPGLNEKQVGEHVAKQVNEVLKQNRRAAVATLPRAGN